MEACDLLVEQPFELLATNLVLVEVKVEEVGIQRLGCGLVLGVVVRLEVRVFQALLDGVPVAGVDWGC